MNWLQRGSLTLTLLATSLAASAAEFTINAIQAPMEEHLEITATGCLRYTKLNGTVILIPKHMIAGAVVTGSRIFIQTMPFPLVIQEDDAQTQHTEPLTFIVVFSINQRKVMEDKLKPIFDR